MEYFVTSGGIPLHVSLSGEGERTLLFLHGYLETLYIWDDFRELLPPGYRTVAIDLPGHGLSGSDPKSNEISFDADVTAAFLRSLDIDKVTVIGHSMGGYVAQSLAKNYPDMVESLVHFNSNPFADSIEQRDKREKEIDFIENGRLLSLAQIAIPNMYAKANLRRMDSKIAETIEICETHDPFGISASVRGLMNREDNVAFLKECSIPVLFIFGDSDTYMPLERARSIHELIPRSTSVFIPNTGHNSFLEEPEAVLDTLMDFIS